MNTIFYIARTAKRTATTRVPTVAVVRVEAPVNCGGDVAETVPLETAIVEMVVAAG